jgi:hypothetical protein
MTLQTTFSWTYLRREILFLQQVTDGEVDDQSGTLPGVRPAAHC